jgi:hypothetical protein
VRLRCAVERVRLLAVERLEFERVDVERLLLVERLRVLVLRRAVLLVLLLRLWVAMWVESLLRVLSLASLPFDALG